MPDPGIISVSTCIRTESCLVSVQRKFNVQRSALRVQCSAQVLAAPCIHSYLVDQI